MRKIGLIIATILLALSVVAPASGAPENGVIPGQYIVTLEAGVSPDDVAQEYRALGANVEHVYSHAIRGFAGAVPPGLVKKLETDPRVSLVEQDQEVHADDTQADPPWGLDRTDQRSLPLSDTYSYDSTGSGIKAYVLDTGVRSTHEQFEGRVISGYDAWGTTTEDCNGHGTHVAGTIAGKDYGIAKQATIVAIRVLGGDCGSSGSLSSVLNGMEWMIADHQAGEPAVANMSWGGGKNSTINDAITNVVNDGIIAVTSAGNSDADACGYSPASAPEAVTVGATSSSDTRAYFSNYGTCLDLFAPGVSVLSARAGSDTAAGYASGTSMASPHVSGVALLLWDQNPTFTRADVEAMLIETSTKDVVTDVLGSPNRLAYINATIEEPVNTPPTAKFQSSCTDLACDFDGSGSSDSDGSISSYEWNFGDGTTAFGSFVSHTYGAAGTYTVTLTVTDNDGATDSTSSTVTVEVKNNKKTPPGQDKDKDNGNGWGRGGKPK